MSEPITNDCGIIWNNTMIPAAPLQYVPARGEYGIGSDGKFLPIEPPIYYPGMLRRSDLPILSTPQSIDREPPFLPQTDMRVAPTCVSPYNWNAGAALRTIILDTVLDADATDEEKALPGYVANPGLTLTNQTYVDFGGTAYDDEDGVGILWTYGASPANPHPALRTGQTRYSFPSNAKVGTDYAGEAFLPGTVGAFVGGTLKTCAYRYGFLLSSIQAWTIAVKIGRATATWDQSAETLTLACNTTGATIKYSTDGSVPTVTYTGPISIADTTTVRWKATKAGMVDSDEWQTYIGYQDEAPPADFETVYFSALPAFDNSSTNVAFMLQRRPDWYVSPGATGDGRTPSTPGDAATIIGLSAATPAKPGLAVGWRQVTAMKSGTANVALNYTLAESLPSGYKKRYSTDDGASWSDYSAAFSLPVPGEFLAKYTTDTGADWSRTFRFKWFLGTGTGVQIEEEWDSTAKTLALAYAPAPADADDVAILYSLDGGDTTLTYTGPITIAATCTPKARVVHPHRGGNTDFRSQTEVKTLTTIDPESTGDFSNAQAVTFALYDGDASPTLVAAQGNDIVWCSEGTYDNPSNATGNYFKSRPGAIIKGGYNSAFTERDVMGRKTIFSAVKWGSTDAEYGNDYAFYVNTEGLIDGCWFDADMPTAVVTASGSTYRRTSASLVGMGSGAVAYNCHIDKTVSVDGGPALNSFSDTFFEARLEIYVVSGGYCRSCTIAVDGEIGRGEDATGTMIDPWGGNVEYGGSGGTSRVLVSHSAINHDCDISLRAVSLGGGNGKSVSSTRIGVYPGGAGGSYAKISCGTLARCNVNIEVDSGDAGNQGDALAAGDFASGQSEIGPLTDASAYIGSIEDSSVVVTCTSGNGGDSTDIAASIPYYNLFEGGMSFATIETGNIYRSTVDATATAGDGGDGGQQPGAGYSGPSGYPQAHFSAQLLSFSTLAADATAGANGAGEQSSADPFAYVSTTLGARVALSGSATNGTRGYLVTPVSPTFFEPGAVSFTESAPWGDGNAVRVDHADGSTTGWYSGLDNGNGAPLAGYETPQGSGVALGRYWE